MGVAAIGKTFPRVSWIIGARGSSFNSSLDNDNFIAEEITRALIETESEIASDLADSRHPMRNSFLAWSSDLTNESILPAHLGEVEACQIKKHSAGSYELGEATTRENVKLWRENYQNVFDAINHNASGSSLSGYFNITGETLTFTGHTAQVKLFTFTPNQSAHQVDEIFENAIVAGAIPKLLKIGVSASLVAHYGNQYAAMRNLIRSGHLQMPHLVEAQKSE